MVNKQLQGERTFVFFLKIFVVVAYHLRCACVISHTEGCGRTHCFDTQQEKGGALSHATTSTTSSPPDKPAVRILVKVQIDPRCGKPINSLAHKEN